MALHRHKPDVARKIRLLRREGRPAKQAIAIALDLKRRRKLKRTIAHGG